MRGVVLAVALAMTLSSCTASDRAPVPESSPTTTPAPVVVPDVSQLTTSSTSIRTATEPSVEANIAVSGGRMPILATVDFVWVASQSSTLVQRIDPATNRLAGELQRSETTNVLIEAFGAVWACGPGALDRIDPTTLRITATYLPGCRFGVAAGFGSLWVVAGTTVVRLDPTTGIEQARISVTGGTWGITATTTAVWVADGHFGPGTVSRIDPTTNSVVAEIASPVRTRNLLASDSAVWITAESRPGHPISLLRLDPATNTIAATADAPGDAVGLARMGDHIWVIGYGGDVAAVDTRTNVVAFHQRLVQIESSLGGDRVAAGFGSIWIGTQRPGLVTRIDPGPYR